MTTRSRLDEIEDYHFAVNKFIHQGKYRDQVTSMLKARGADEDQINSIFISIFEKYQGVRLLESGNVVRAVNFLIDILVLLFLIYSIFSRLSEEVRFSYILLVLFIPLAYYVLLESTIGQTLGKFVTGSIVVQKDGKKISFLKALIRGVCRFFPNSISSAFFKDRIFHDKISETYVVDKKRWTTSYENENIGKMPGA